MNSCWEMVETDGEYAPSNRSLHAAAQWGDSMYIFGGYDGNSRVNDFYEFHFPSRRWNNLLPSDPNLEVPSPRDRHTAVVYNRTFYIFGGFDGNTRKNDFYGYDFDRNMWNAVAVSIGSAPSARHSHCAVIYEKSMFVFGGYDSAYKNDLNEYNFASEAWGVVLCSGRLPRARYRATCVVHNDSMIMFGGHDGTRHLNDVNVFNLTSRVWSQTLVEGYNPTPRDSHIAVVYGNSMFIYGGSTGSATDDFQELRLFPGRQMWVPIRTDRVTCSTPPRAIMITASSPLTRGGGAAEDNYRYVLEGLAHINNENAGDAEFPLSFMNPVYNANAGGALAMGSGNLMGFSRTGYGGIPPPPSPQHRRTPVVSQASTESLPGLRFCHVACVYEGCLYIFGGYDGTTRLGDFLRFRFGPAPVDCSVPPSVLLSDMLARVNNSEFSDVTFIVEDQPIYAHKIICSRCPVLKTMFKSEMLEGRLSEIPILDVRHAIFLRLVEYLYTDDTLITLENAMEMFQVADRFGVDRLKRLCENLMLSSLNIDNAAHILYAADLFDAKGLRERCLSYIVAYFNDVSKTSAFEEVGRSNVNLIFEILKRR